MHETTPKHLTRERGVRVLSRDPVLVVESTIAVLAIVLAMTMVLTSIPDEPGSGKAPGGGVAGGDRFADAAGTPSVSSRPALAGEPASGGVSEATVGVPPTVSSGFGNPVNNWSFEQDLSGWQVIGDGDAARQPQGRTSGSCASVRARRQGQVGLWQPGVVRGAEPGRRYVAKAWVRSTAPGVKVTVRLAGTGAKPEGSQAGTTTLPGLAWRAVIVDHTVTAKTDLAVQITADGVPAGDALLVDEVTVRQG
jgi:hypothetical protein